jgi:membrane protein DedA with SNARE-associated domain
MTFEWLLELLRAHPAVTPAVLFVVAFGEALIFTSPIVPATVLLLAIGGLHQAAGGHFATIVAAAAFGTFLGDIASFLIARKHRETIGGWWPLKNNPGWLPRAMAFIQKWGVPGLIATKFLGPLRWFGPAVCGVLLMPFARFLAVTAFASVLWAALLLAGPYYGVKALGT